MGCFSFVVVVVVVFFITLLITTEIYSLLALSFFFSRFLLNMNKIVLEPKQKFLANAIKEGKCTNINIK